MIYQKITKKKILKMFKKMIYKCNLIKINKIHRMMNRTNKKSLKI